MLGDRTGELDAKMWDNVARSTGNVRPRRFRQGQRPAADLPEPAAAHDAQDGAPGRTRTSILGDYFPASERNPDEMFAELRASSTRSAILIFTLCSTLSWTMRTSHGCIAPRPPRRRVHHAFLGGLLEHVLSVCQLCRATASHYKGVDVDLLMTGAILHDIGKIDGAQLMSGLRLQHQGQLLGHIVIGMQMLDDKTRAGSRFSALASNLA